MGSVQEVGYSVTIFCWFGYLCGGGYKSKCLLTNIQKRTLNTWHPNFCGPFSALAVIYNPPGNLGPPARFLLTPMVFMFCPPAPPAPPDPCWPGVIFSKFLRSIVNQCLVDLSSLRHSENVSSFSWSGRH